MRSLTLRSPAHAVVAIAVVILLAAVGIPVLLDGYSRDQTVTLRVGASGPRTDLERLIAAPIVAIVLPTGAERVHWNNSTNTVWTSESMTRPAVVWRDQAVTVVDVLKGSLPKAAEIRNVGGLADGVRFEFDGGAAFDSREPHLVFLEWGDTPMREGTERRLVVYTQAGGVFIRGEVPGTWYNSFTDVTITETDLKQFE